MKTVMIPICVLFVVGCQQRVVPQQEGQRLPTGQANAQSRRQPWVGPYLVAGEVPEATIAVTAAAFSPDGRRALTGDGAGVITLWDLATGKKILSLVGQPNNKEDPVRIIGHDVTTIAFLPDGHRAFSVDCHLRLKLWDLRAEKEVPFVKG